jgi:peptidoglycan/xylan/chitin deacetylase (PgdA/CDA1 family)
VSSRVTIVMYHYVRDLRRSRYPRIKGLDLEDFRGQLAFFERHYNVIGAAELLDAVKRDEPLPPRALLLTFDDGYIDHFTYVFPLLSERKWSACFFPVAETATGNKVLDVNKIHFILAATEQPQKLVERVMQTVEVRRAELNLDAPRQYWERCSGDSRYDTPEVTFVKRMLQRELPESLRASLVDELFRDWVTADEAAFAQELYMSPTQLRCMIRFGMTVGNHGAGHYWMNKLSAAEQEREVDASLEFLRSLSISERDWLMCYPYGGVDERLQSLVARRGASLGFATTVGIADLRSDHALTLPRLDTNDLPKSATAAPNAWVEKAGAA